MVGVARIAMLACTAVLVLACYGDPHWDISVRNDSASQIVIGITQNQPRGDDEGIIDPIGFVVGPHALGVALSNAGSFHGRVTVHDLTSCAAIGELEVHGGLIYIVVSAAGVPVINKNDIPSSDRPQLETSTACGVGS